MEEGQIADLQNQNVGVDGSTFPNANQAETKFIPQHKVNEIVEEAKLKAADKARREMLEQMQKPQIETSQPVAPSLGGIQQFSPDDIRRMIAEETQRQQQEHLTKHQQEMLIQEAHKIANEFTTKLQLGKDRYSDFDKKMEALDLKTIPHIVQLANGVDNTADVMHELYENPSKIGILHSLAATNPNLARLEMVRLSESIKANQAASNQKLANAPLSQNQPSNVGTDNGSLSIKDLKKQPWLRG